MLKYISFLTVLCIAASAVAEGFPPSTTSNDPINGSANPVNNAISTSQPGYDNGVGFAPHPKTGPKTPKDKPKKGKKRHHQTQPPAEQKQPDTQPAN